MSALPVTISRSSSEVAQTSDSQELSLVALLDLFEPEEHDGASAPARGPVGTPRPGLRARTREWVQRAAGWGAGPDAARRAW